MVKLCMEGKRNITFLAISLLSVCSYWMAGQRLRYYLTANDNCVIHCSLFRICRKWGEWEIPHIGLIWFLQEFLSPVESVCFKDATVKTSCKCTWAHQPWGAHGSLVFLLHHLKSTSFKVVIPSSGGLVTTCQNEAYYKIWKETGNLGRWKPVT